MNSNDGGKLSIQLRNKRYGTKKGERSDVNANPSLNGEDATNAIEILKSMPVAESTMDEFKRLLNSTLEYRRTKLKSEEELNLQEYFPYFFVSTELVKLFGSITCLHSNRLCHVHRFHMIFHCDFKVLISVHSKIGGNSTLLERHVF